MEYTRKEIEQQIVERAMKDEEFRNKLKSDPGSTIEETFGVKFPESLNFHLNEETPNDIHITLPVSEEELSEEQLSGISGGGWGSSTPRYK